MKIIGHIHRNLTLITPWPGAKLKYRSWASASLAAPYPELNEASISYLILKFRTHISITCLFTILSQSGPVLHSLRAFSTMSIHDTQGVVTNSFRCVAAQCNCTGTSGNTLIICLNMCIRDLLRVFLLDQLKLDHSKQKSVTEIQIRLVGLRGLCSMTWIPESV